MESETAPEGLPSGWTVEVTISGGHKRKCYVDPKSGRKFYSKQQVSRHLEITNSIVEQKPADDGLSGYKSYSEPDGSETHGAMVLEGTIAKWKKEGSSRDVMNDVTERMPADGLPAGWIKEVRTMNVKNRIRKDPYYLDPSTGYVFRSKMDALRYLETGDVNKCAIKPRKMNVDDVPDVDDLGSGGKSSSVLNASQSGTVAIRRSITKPNKDSSLKHDVNNVVERALAEVEGLPAGWTKEVRTRIVKGMIKKDPYYIDSSSGYIFRSKVDAMRYLETGDINKCAMKPKKMSADENSVSISRAGSKRISRKPGRMGEGEENFVGKVKRIKMAGRPRQTPSAGRRGGGQDAVKALGKRIEALGERVEQLTSTLNTVREGQARMDSCQLEMLGLIRRLAAEPDPPAQ